MSSTRILVVEDDRRTAQTIRLYLEHAGYGVELAHDGETGLREAGSGDYALVVLDLMLPGRDGLEICQALRRSPVPPPIILLTARAASDPYRLRRRLPLLAHSRCVVTSRRESSAGRASACAGVCS